MAFPQYAMRLASLRASALVYTGREVGGREGGGEGGKEGGRERG